MSFLKELNTIREGAVKRAIMDKIEKAIKLASKRGLDADYNMALTQIADALCKIDAQADKGQLTTGMTMGALRDMIKPHYSKEEHERELVKEDSVKDALMNTICHLAQGARLSGKSYDAVVKSIAAQFRKLDKHDSSEMSDEALIDMIMSYYNEDRHLAQDNAVTNNRDVSYDYVPVRENVEDDQAEIAAKFDKLYKSAKGKIPAKDLRDFQKMFNKANDHFNTVYQNLDDEDEDSNEALEQPLETMQDVVDEFKEHIKKVLKEGTITEEEYKDRKAEAIGMATKWFKDNFKKFELPLHVMRVPSSGNYIMASKVTGEKSKWVYVKWIEGTGEEGTIKQTSSKEWKAAKIQEDAFGDDKGGNGSLDNQQQAGIPAGAVDPNQGPEGAETEVPAGPRVIAKAGDFKVQLGKNEQVQIIDGKGSIRLSMPMVIWKELTRQ